jgi:hypothetical protein
MNTVVACRTVSSKIIQERRIAREYRHFVWNHLDFADTFPVQRQKENATVSKKSVESV